jgi:hypothetical protein
MDDGIELITFLENLSARRTWLLTNALRSVPFDRAIELARIAEAFVTGAASGTEAGPARIAPELNPIEDADHISGTTDRPTKNKPLPLKPAAHEHGSFAVDSAERDRLLDRLAQGARNAELAGEFGLPPKQVQGVRMGCAREIARRRERLSEPVPAQIATPKALIEDVVRFLRQQDDVVVPQENGNFLVNSRFQMPLSELVARANRIRARQGKPVFELETVPRNQASAANGHPLFWDQPSARERVGNGSHQPDAIETC